MFTAQLQNILNAKMPCIFPICTVWGNVYRHKNVLIIVSKNRVLRFSTFSLFAIRLLNVFSFSLFFCSWLVPEFCRKTFFFTCDNFYGFPLGVKWALVFFYLNYVECVHSKIWKKYQLISKPKMAFRRYFFAFFLLFFFPASLKDSRKQFFWSVYIWTEVKDTL